MHLFLTSIHDIYFTIILKILKRYQNKNETQ